jgi:hypothetical protein
VVDLLADRFKPFDPHDLRAHDEPFAIGALRNHEHGLASAGLHAEQEQILTIEDDGPRVDAAVLPAVVAKPRLTPLWHVVLLDDDDHTYDYVIEMLSALFHHNASAAYRMAREVDMDLVEVAPTERPPVCKIMDFGKFKYELSKKEQKSRSASKATKSLPGS